MNQKQKQYAAKRVDEISAEARITLRERVTPDHEVLGELEEKRAAVRNDLTGIRPASPSVLKAKIQYALDQAGAKSDSMFDGHPYASPTLFLGDLVVTDRDKEVVALDKEIAKVEKRIELFQENIRAKQDHIDRLATASKDAIVLGAEGLVALEEFTAAVDDILES